MAQALRLVSAHGASYWESNEWPVAVRSPWRLRWPQPGYPWGPAAPWWPKPLAPLPSTAGFCPSPGPSARLSRGWGTKSLGTTCEPLVKHSAWQPRGSQRRVGASVGLLKPGPLPAGIETVRIWARSSSQEKAWADLAVLLDVGLPSWGQTGLCSSTCDYRP